MKSRFVTSHYVTKVRNPRASISLVPNVVIPPAREGAAAVVTGRDVPAVVVRATAREVAAAVVTAPGRDVAAEIVTVAAAPGREL